MRDLLHQTYDAADLARTHPLQLSNANKQLVHELCGPQTTGSIAVSRWSAEALPEHVDPNAPRVELIAGYFDYAEPGDGVWHLNFADPDLFFAYGSSLLAQDELQCAEHPALGSIRDALDGDALTVENDQPTPVLVAGVERRCTIDTAPTASRPRGLYGNHFAAASADDIRDAVRVHRPAPLSNIIAISAIPGGRGAYSRAQIEYTLATAYTGFAAAAAETARLSPGAPTEIRTGFWGCGAFGGNRDLMTLLQLLAARLAGVNVKFYASDDAGRADFLVGSNALARVLDGASSTSDVLDRIVALGFRWGFGNGT